MGASKAWVVCIACGKKDATRPGHVGTRRVMRCPDCANPYTGTAEKCRDCCPTGHRTRERV